ncbi:MAG: hypothetical protein U5R31_04425 [Acidimicrobiia bacterium]|nr:hypothetical protein [Acidimicrobiia bacterium]
MSRRIEIELTSARDDGTWTWRAAGAREPKGTLDGQLLHKGATVGEVLRAEADFDVDGISIIEVLPPRRERSEPERLELLGTGGPSEGVTTQLVGKRGGGKGRDGRRRGRRDDRKGSDRDRRRDGDEGAGSGKGTRPPRSETPKKPKPPKPPRLRPRREHRDGVLAELAPEQRPIAEQVLRGGLPAVRQAIEKQNEEARSAGRPEVQADALLSLAEELLPRLREAEWRDRADAALAGIDEIDLRDLRSVVVAADAGARSADAREQAQQLRDSLAERVDREHRAWLAELASAVADGRTVRARSDSAPVRPRPAHPCRRTWQRSSPSRRQRA